MNTFWFRPRRYGYGATPSSWQGWAVIAAYVVVLLATTWLMPPGSSSLLTYLLVVFAETAVLIAVCRARTDGPWRWRWGED